MPITANLTPRNCGSVPVNLPKSSLKNRFGPEVILCVRWKFEGVIHWEFVTKVRAVDEDLYSQQLERVHDILRRRVLLQQDNARAHAARTAMTKIQELGGIKLLQHPAYSPDLALSHYRLFWYMAHFVRRKIFRKHWTCGSGCHQILRGIINLAERWLKIIVSDGLFFEEQFNFLSENIPNKILFKKRHCVWGSICTIIAW